MTTNKLALTICASALAASCRSPGKLGSSDVAEALAGPMADAVVLSGQADAGMSIRVLQYAVSTTQELETTRGFTGILGTKRPCEITVPDGIYGGSHKAPKRIFQVTVVPVSPSGAYDIKLPSFTPPKDDAGCEYAPDDTTFELYVGPRDQDMRAMGLRTNLTPKNDEFLPFDGLGHVSLSQNLTADKDLPPSLDLLCNLSDGSKVAILCNATNYVIGGKRVSDTFAKSWYLPKGYKLNLALDPVKPAFRVASIGIHIGTGMYNTLQLGAVTAAQPVNESVTSSDFYNGKAVTSISLKAAVDGRPYPNAADFVTVTPRIVSQETGVPNPKTLYAFDYALRNPKGLKGSLNTIATITTSDGRTQDFVVNALLR